MRGELNFENVIDHLDRRVPEFTGYDHVKGETGVYFVFFSIFLVKVYNDDAVLSKAVSFINDMVDSNDEDLVIILDDLFLDVYHGIKEARLSEERFLSRLSQKALTKYNRAVQWWLNANRNL